jgi:predicted transcriptional regulator
MAINVPEFDKYATCAEAGKVLWSIVSRILKQAGDSTARNLVGGNLLNDSQAHSILQPFVDDGLLERVNSRWYRLTEKGRDF